MTLPRVVVVFAAMCSLAVAFPALAQKKDEHGHNKESHFKVTPPPDLKAAWSLISTKLAAAEKNLADQKVDAIHEDAEHLEAAIHVLQEKSTMVTGDKQTRLASALKQLDKAVDDLHHAAEDKKAAQAGVEIKKIRGLLPLVEGQYPAGTLK